MSSKLLTIFGGIIVITFVSAFVFLQGSSKEDENSLFPDIVLGEYNENTLAAFRGKPVVANTWATWCPFCVNELPDFVEIQKEFGDEVVILAINRKESPSRVSRFIGELGIADDLTFLLDPNDSFYREIGGFSMPETIFVDRDGVIQFHKRGPMDADEIRQRLQSIL